MLLYISKDIKGSSLVQKLGWSLPIGGVAPGMVCTQPAKQTCLIYINGKEALLL